MAKMRGIKPETFTDDKVLQLSPLARWMFVGMWTLACDNGHVEDNAVQLKVRLLPVDNCDVDALLDELLNTGQVVRHDGYLKVDKLAEHQRIDRRYLLLCEWCEHDVHAVYSEADRTGARRAPDVHTAGTRRAPIDEGEGEGEGEKKVKVNNLLVEQFANFWTAFPSERKRAKPDCQKLFTQAVKEGTNPDTIIQAAKRYRDDPNREAQFTVNPKTWLREQRWESGPLPARTPTQGTHGDRFDDWERAAQLVNTQQHQLRAIEGGTQ